MERWISELYQPIRCLHRRGVSLGFASPCHPKGSPDSSLFDVTCGIYHTIVPARNVVSPTWILVAVVFIVNYTSPTWYVVPYCHEYYNRFVSGDVNWGDQQIAENTGSLIPDAMPTNPFTIIFMVSPAGFYYCNNPETGKFVSPFALYRVFRRPEDQEFCRDI